jgi:predicted kinase
MDGLAVLIILGGLPGVGKTTIARELALQLGAVHIRIDSIEQAIRDAKGNSGPLDETGYRVGYAVALDNLRVGRTVIADSVNPIAISRNAWLEVAIRAQVRAIEVELKCSDVEEQRNRIENRVVDIAGLPLLTWQAVTAREYHAWDREHLVIDTAVCSVRQAVKIIKERWLNSGR